MLGIGARHNAEAAEMFETETFADPPSHKMIRAGLVTADPDRADFYVARFIQGEPAAKHIDPADLLPD